MRIVFFGNIFIAMCAAALSAGTVLMLGRTPAPEPLFLFVFFSTLTIYSLNRLPLLIGKIPHPLSEKAEWTLRNKKIFIAIFFVAASGTLALIPFLEAKILSAIGLAGLIAIPYTIAFPFRKPLREIPYLKIFLIALTWGLVTSTLPALSLGREFTEPEIVKLFISRFLLIFAIAVPFDIRDVGRDRTSGIKTIPAALGTGRAKAIALGALAMAAFLEWGMLPVKQAAVLTFSSFAAAALIIFSSEKKSELYFLGLVDGIMVLRFLLLLLVSAL